MVPLPFCVLYYRYNNNLHRLQGALSFRTATVIRQGRKVEMKTTNKPSSLHTPPFLPQQIQVRIFLSTEESLYFIARLEYCRHEDVKTTLLHYSC